MMALASRVRQRPSQSSEGAVISFLRAMVVTYPLTAERFHVLFLDDLRNYLGDAHMGDGVASALSVRMREVFAKALSLRASGIIIAHNHPSGECRPSEFDIASTKRLKSVAEALDIELLDHLIFTQDAVYSMRAGGNL